MTIYKKKKLGYIERSWRSVNLLIKRDFDPNGKFTNPNKKVCRSTKPAITWISCISIANKTTLLCHKMDTPPKFVYRTTDDMTKSFKTSLTTSLKNHVLSYRKKILFNFQQIRHQSKNKYILLLAINNYLKHW